MIIKPLEDISVLSGFHCGIQAIVNAIADMAQKQKMAGCMFLTVEAYIEKDYSAVPFYNVCGFEPCEYRNPNKETLRMYKTLYPRID